MCAHAMCDDIESAGTRVCVLRGRGVVYKIYEEARVTSLEIE